VKAKIVAEVDTSSGSSTSPELRAHLESLLSAGTEITWAADGEGRIEWVDCRGLDYLREPMIGLKWSQVPAVHPDDRAGIEERWQDALGSGRAYESQHRLRRHDGQYRWFSARAFPLLNRQGEIVRWFGSSADIHEIKLAEQAFHETEIRIDAELGLVRSPEEDSVDLELAHLLDVRAIQSIVESLRAVTKMSIQIQDAHGTDLIGTGWQRICAELHRRNKETCQQCVESDRLLLEGVTPGQVRIQKCKNGLWDMASPIVVDGRRVGNIFSGQYFFEGDEPDRELFRARARNYGFDEEDYLAALDEVPRLGREIVEEGMAFLPKLANLVSELSYNHIKIDRSVAQRSGLVDLLRMQQATIGRVEAVARIGSWRLEADSRKVFLSDEACLMLGVPKKTHLTLDEALAMVHPADHQQVCEAATDRRADSLDLELRILAGQNVPHIDVRAWLEHDQEGQLARGYGLVLETTADAT